MNELALATRLGGTAGEESRELARKYIDSCKAKGGEWIKRDEMLGVDSYLYMERLARHVLDHCSILAAYMIHGHLAHDSASRSTTACGVTSQMIVVVVAAIDSYLLLLLQVPADMRTGGRRLYAATNISETQQQQQQQQHTSSSNRNEARIRSSSGSSNISSYR